MTFLPSAGGQASSSSERATVASQDHKEARVQDLAYLVATVAFFALMIAFVKGCERIVGEDGDAVPGGIDEQPAAVEAEPVEVTS
jgi:hypothetical protein